MGAKYKSLSQRFVEKYVELEKNNEKLTPDEIMSQTEENLRQEGVLLKASTQAASRRDPEFAGRDRDRGASDDSSVQSVRQTQRPIDVSKILQE